MQYHGCLFESAKIISDSVFSPNSPDDAIVIIQKTRKLHEMSPNVLPVQEKFKLNLNSNPKFDLS